MSMKKYRVTRAYQSPYEQGVMFRIGQRLRFERRESEWPGWIWCTSTSGESAWTPENWVRINGDRCVVTREYSSQELSVELGEEIVAMLEESGWVLATNQAGKGGWVALSHLQAL